MLLSYYVNMLLKYWANYMLTNEKLRRKSESDAQNQLLWLKNRSQGKVNTRDFGALLTSQRYVCKVRNLGLL